MQNLEDRREIVENRLEFIELLDNNGPMEPRDVTDELEYSRSTVTRALRELRDVDLIEKEEEGYTAKLPGKMAAREYRRYEAASTAIFNSKELLEPIPESQDRKSTRLNSSH